MGFLDSMGNAARRAQLNGEIVLVDREMAARKRLFGVELFDIIAKQDKRNQSSIVGIPGMFKTIENEIKGPLEECSEDLRLLELEKTEKENESLMIDVKRDKHTESSFGKRMSATAREAQLAVQINLKDREIRQRKEKFGLEIWDAVSQPQWVHEAVAKETKEAKRGLGIVKGAIGGLGKGVKGTVTKTLGKVSGDERQVEACVTKAKDDIKYMEDNKERKQREIERTLK